MTEVWLRSNRRILVLAMIPLLMLTGLGVLLQNANWFWPGIACFLLSAFLFVGLVTQLIRPRVAYRDDHVLFYLKSGGPIVIPLQVVEAFFQGEGLAHLPGEAQHHAKSVNLIARLSQRETDWHEREVKPALGRWSEGYVTIRGTWCEPITGDLIRQLNRRLGEVSRARKAKAEA